MKYKLTYICVLLLLFSITAFSQSTEKDSEKEKLKEVEAKAIELLNETRSEINTLRTIENRISFSSELANLMWYHDADEGKRMFGEITDDFVELFARYNAEISSYGGVKSDTELHSGRFSPSDKSKAIGRMKKAINVRQQIALGIAAHDAERGYDFVIRTGQIITDPVFQKQIEQQDKRVESGIIAYMAQQDVDKALALSRKALKKKFRKSMLSLLEKVNNKDKDKARDFASEILSKVKSEIKKPKGDFNAAYSVLEFARKNIEESKKSPDNKPIFDRDDMADLASTFAGVLTSRDDAKSSYMLDQYYDTIKEFSPSNANRLKTKYKDSISDGSDGDKDAVKIAVERVADQVGNGDAIEVSPADQRKAEEEAKKAEILRKLKSGDLTELSKEDKQKFVDEAQGIVRTFKNPTEKIAGLSGLATQVKQLGDDKLASELMNEASLLINTQPQNYIDYMQIWTLVIGYSNVEPDKAFPILENTIYQLNDTLEAFVKVGEFIDVNGDLIIDNEVQLGTFGGSMTQGFVGQLGGSENVIGNLAIADFEKTKGLADRFSRTELRIFVKLMIMRSVLDDGKKSISRENLYGF